MAAMLPVLLVQGISTGKYHAAVMTNNEQWEIACVRAGRSSGDLAHPLVYCPELHFSEFTSAVADMKNSVAVSDRAAVETPAPSNEPDFFARFNLTLFFFFFCPLFAQDRENAQSSCAGLFIGSHLGFDWPGIWVHVDIASPVHAVSSFVCLCPLCMIVSCLQDCSVSCCSAQTSRTTLQDHMSPAIKDSPQSYNIYLERTSFWSF